MLQSATARPDDLPWVISRSCGKEAQTRRVWCYCRRSMNWVKRRAIIAAYSLSCPLSPDMWGASRSPSPAKPEEGLGRGVLTGVSQNPSARKGGTGSLSFWRGDVDTEDA